MQSMKELIQLLVKNGLKQIFFILIMNVSQKVLCGEYAFLNDINKALCPNNLLTPNEY